MTPELHEFLLVIAMFLLGCAAGYTLKYEQHLREVDDWKAIARKAQLLNRLAETLEQERRANGDREHTH